MFALCDAMKWAQLPVFGGIYDQNPYLLECFRYIFAERGKQQERERKQQERQTNAAQRSTMGGRR
jgi:hypothetical protein